MQLSLFADEWRCNVCMRDRNSVPGVLTMWTKDLCMDCRRKAKGLPALCP